jgi:signal transduction histidine kinase/ActR/RegA family two-component response regulator
MIIGISVAISLGFLAVGLSFFSFLAEELRTTTRLTVTQILAKHRESFALEIFLRKFGAQRLRLGEIVDEGSAIARDFGICLFRPSTREVLLNTYSNCDPDTLVPGFRTRADGFSEVTYSLDSGLAEDTVFIKARYRDAGDIRSAAKMTPITAGVAVGLLVFLVIGVTVILERYHETILARATEMERETQTSRAIALTAKMIAHDVRKPFTMLEWIMGVLVTTKDPVQAKQLASKHISDVRSAITRVNVMMEDVMLMGSPERLSVQVICPEALIETSLTEAFARFPKACVAFEFHMNHGHCIRVDLARVTRVFENIITNAVQATRQMGTITFSTREISILGAAFVEFRIHNSDSLIAQGDLKRLFEPFFTKGKKHGTGLGLAICKQIITNHGGDIWAESEHGKGTCIVFTCPATLPQRSHYEGRLPRSSQELRDRVVLASDSDGRAFGEAPSLDAGNVQDQLMSLQETLGRSFRILIADDETIYRTVLTQLIHRSKVLSSLVDVTEAENAEDAVSCCRRSDFDLVIMDNDFGAGEKGIEALARIREIGSKNFVCMHSHYDSAEDRHQFLEAGADLFLPKPAAKQHLMSVIQKALIRATEIAEKTIFEGQNRHAT